MSRPIPTADDRLERLNRRLVMLEGLLGLVDAEDRGGSLVVADLSTVVTCARQELREAYEELRWVWAAPGLRELAAPGADTDCIGRRLRD